MSVEKVIKSRTFYLVLAVLVALFVWMLYTGADVELYSSTDTFVRNTLKIKKPVLFVRQDAVAGAYLSDVTGKNLYTFANDEAGISKCTGECLAMWPPFIVRNIMIKIEGPATGTIGTIKTAKGKYQVTYNGKPLYYFAMDTKAGELAGTKVENWFAARP